MFQEKEEAGKQRLFGETSVEAMEPRFLESVDLGEGRSFIGVSCVGLNPSERFTEACRRDRHFRPEPLLVLVPVAPHL